MCVRNVRSHRTHNATHVWHVIGTRRCTSTDVVTHRRIGHPDARARRVQRLVVARHACSERRTSCVRVWRRHRLCAIHLTRIHINSVRTEGAGVGCGVGNGVAVSQRPLVSHRHANIAQRARADVGTGVGIGVGRGVGSGVGTGVGNGVGSGFARTQSHTATRPLACTHCGRRRRYRSRRRL
jgi:hypothetical protein